MGTAPPSRLRLVFIAAALGLHSLALFAGQPAADQQRRHIALLLLIDRSPNLGATAEPNRGFTEEVSTEILKEVKRLAEHHDASFSFGAINFGGKLGNQLPIREVPPGESPPLPRAEVIANTNLRVALRAAYEASKSFRQRQPFGGLLVVFVTNNLPLVLAMGDDSPRKLKNDIENLDGKVCFVRSQGGSSGARDWIKQFGKSSVVLIEQGNLSVLQEYIQNLVLQSLREESAILDLKSDPNGSGQPSVAPSASAPDPLLPSALQWHWPLEGLVGAAVGFLLTWVVLRRPGGSRAWHWFNRHAASLAAKRGYRAMAEDLLENGSSKTEHGIEQINRRAEEEKAPLRRQLSAYLLQGLAEVEEESGKREFIKKQLKSTASRERVQKVAELLLDRWSKGEGKFEEELFVFTAELMGGALLDGVVTAPSHTTWDSEQVHRCDLLRQLATSLTNLRQALAQRSENLPEYLQVYAQSLREAIELQPNPPFLSFEIYELLEDYLWVRPIGRAYVLEPLPIHLREMVPAVLEDRGTDFSLGESVDGLLALQAKVEQGPWRSLPEAKALLVAVERWRGIVSGSESDLLELSLSPFLDHGGELESANDSDGKRSSAFPICIRNRGLVPARKIDLVLSEGCDGAGSELLGGSESGGAWRKRVEDLNGGASRTELIRVRHGLKPVFSIQADYLCDRVTGWRGESNILQLVSEPNEPRTEAAGSGNPYRPDAPLTAPQQWNLLAQGEHQAIIERIVGDPSLREGRAYAILGLRRTGKTSLLRWLAWRLEETDEFLPVYIDIFLWYRSLNRQSGKKELNERELYYEIAEAAIRAATLRFKRDFRDQPDEFGEEQKMERSPEELGRVVSDLGRGIEKRVIIIVDDLDWWLNKAEFSDTGQEILAPLCLLANEGNFSLLISHDLVTAAWKERYRLDEPLLPTPYPIPLLEQEDVERLLASAGAPFTLMAREYLWRVTGGWPGVVHLFAYGVMEEWYRNVPGRESRVIDVDFARTTVKLMIHSSAYQHFFKYFVEALEESEQEMLAAVARFGFIDRGSMILRGFQHDANGALKIAIPQELGEKFSASTVRSLIEKQIVEGLDGSARACRLRVGFLAFPHVFEEISPNPFEVDVEEDLTVLTE